MIRWPMRSTTIPIPTPLVVTLLLAFFPTIAHESDQPRDPGLGRSGWRVGVFPPGQYNAITDVPGVRVGQVTVWEGDDVRTGVTAILPHGGNIFQEKVPAAVVVGNGFGKLLGVTQVRELGEMETPILLTCTLCVWRAADAMVEWLLEQEGMEGVGSINPVVGETNDGGLNDIRSRPIRPEHVREALEAAAAGPVEEGSVGAGTGTQAFGWKGGIGTSSRVLPEALGRYTWGSWSNPTMGASSPWAGPLWGRSWDDTPSSDMWRLGAGTRPELRTVSEGTTTEGASPMQTGDPS